MPDTKLMIDNLADVIRTEAASTVIAAAICTIITTNITFGKKVKKGSNDLPNYRYIMRISWFFTFI